MHTRPRGSAPPHPIQSYERPPTPRPSQRPPVPLQKADPTRGSSRSELNPPAASSRRSACCSSSPSTPSAQPRDARSFLGAYGRNAPTTNSGQGRGEHTYSHEHESLMPTTHRSVRASRVRTMAMAPSMGKRPRYLYVAPAQRAKARLHRLRPIRWGARDANAWAMSKRIATAALRPT